MQKTLEEKLREATERVNTIQPKRETSEMSDETRFRKDFSIEKFKESAESRGVFPLRPVELAKKTTYPNKAAQEMQEKYVESLEKHQQPKEDALSIPLQTKVKVGEESFDPKDQAIMDAADPSMSLISRTNNKVDVLTELNKSQAISLREKNIERELRTLPSSLKEAMLDGRITFSGLEDFGKRVEMSFSESDQEKLKVLKKEYPKSSIQRVKLGDRRIDGLYFTKDFEAAEELEKEYKAGNITKEEYLSNENRWDKLDPSFLTERGDLKGAAYSAADLAKPALQTGAEAGVFMATRGAASGASKTFGRAILESAPVKAGLTALGFTFAEEGIEYINKTQAQDFFRCCTASSF